MEGKGYFYSLNYSSSCNIKNIKNLNCLKDFMILFFDNRAHHPFQIVSNSIL